MQCKWTMLDPRMTRDHLGFLPMFLNEDDPRPAKEQIDAHYQHGGGWRSMKGFKLTGSLGLSYPGDPILKPLASTHLRDETILFYMSAIVAIIQKDRSFEVARID